MNNLKIKDILYSSFIMFVFFLILILSECYLSFSPSLERNLSFLRLIISCFIIFLYILRFKFNKFTILLFVYFAIGTISSYFGLNSNILTFFKSFYNILGFSLYFEMCIKNDTKKTLGVLNSIFIILITINFITILKYPNGMYSDSLYSSNWFFKYDNQHAFLYFPALLVNLLYNKLANKKISLSFIYELVVISFCVLYCFSANTMIAYSIFIFYLIFNNILDKTKIVNIKNFFYTYLGAFFLIVIFRLQNIFNYFITKVLGKNLTFSSRTILWDRVIAYIKQKPLLGYGGESTKVFSFKMGSNNFTHAHNTFLDITYKFGIAGLITHLLLLFISVLSLYKEKHEKISKIISIVFFCMMIMMLMEAREDKTGLYLVMVLAYNVKVIIDQYKGRENNDSNKEELFV